jgi:hypothetical protein
VSTQPKPIPSLPPIPAVQTTGDEENDDELEQGKKEMHWPHTPSDPGHFVPPPTIEEATCALADIKVMLRPPCDSGKGGYKDPQLDRLLRTRLEKMSMFLWNYVDTRNGPNGWMGASLKTAKAFEKGPWLAGRL